MLQDQLIRALVKDAGLELIDPSIAFLGDGCDHDNYLVDGRFVMRIPKKAAVARRLVHRNVGRHNPPQSSPGTPPRLRRSIKAAKLAFPSDIQNPEMRIYSSRLEDILKTSLEIDENLLAKARSVLGTSTIKDTVEESLRVVVRQRGLQEVADLFGKIDLDLTPEKLRRMRRRRTRNAPH